MSTDAKSGSGPHASDGGGPVPSKKHFDTFETKFFEQGDDSGGPPVAVEEFDDLDEGNARRFAPSRQVLVGVGLGSACLAILGCVALWRSGGHTAGKPPVASPAAVASAPPVPAPLPAPAPVAPTAAELAAAPPAPPPAVPPTEPPSAASAEPLPVAPAVPAVAEVKPAPAAAVPAPAGAAESAEAVPARPPVVAPAAEPGSAQAACQKAVHDKRSKEILSACARAFDADPSAAEAALAVARVEFDRGHSVQALVWGKKAVVIDPSSADAYVFIGGAEQSAGHGKAAKEAYRRYLQLAPTGRYATDLRAILGRL